MFKKVILSGLALAVLLVAGILIYINTNLNAIVKAALERYGSEITQTSVSVDTVDIALSSGKGTVSGFHVGNPKSYFAARAIDIGSVSLQLDTSTITGDGPIVIETVTVDDPNVAYEINAGGKANLQTLQGNVSSWSGSKGDAKAAENAKPSRNVIIKNLYINKGKVSVTHSLLGDRKVEADLPTIHLKNIGDKKNGATPEQVAAVVLGAVIKEASRSGGSALKKEMLSIKGLGNDAGESAKKALKNLF